MSHDTAPEHHARPGNPLASQSRAVLAFHARRRYYPEGNIDKVRFIQNEEVPGNILESRFPVLESSDAPVMVTTRNAREAHANAWIDGDKELDARDVTVAMFATSIACGFADGLVSGDLPSFPGARVPCNGTYKMCNIDPETKEITHHGGDASITRIPACMSKYTNLEHLDLRGTNVSRIENLENNVNLKEIRLSGTKVSRIENLDKNVKLEQLWLAGTPVSRIENLDTLVNLETLGLGGTKVSRIENIEKLVKLKELRLMGTKVSRIENLDKNKKLKTLDLGKTKVPGDEKRAFEASRRELTVY